MVIYHKRFSTGRVFLLWFALISLYVTFVRHTRTIQRVRYKANYLPLFECPNSNKQQNEKERQSPYNGIKSNAQQRILLFKDANSEVHTRIVDHLNYLKLPIRIETLTNTTNLLLEIDDEGLYSLIIFTNYSSYENLQENVKFQFHEYAEQFHVGLIYFALNSKCTQIECQPKQQAIQLKFNNQSPIPFISRTDINIDVPNFEVSDWTFLFGPSWKSVLEAEDENGDIKSVIVHKKQLVEEVIIGHDLTNWPITLAFHDIITYFIGISITGDLTRCVQIDIDDIFVAQAGTRLVKDDIGALIKTQEDLRSLIDNFSFTLGFSGSYFKNGDQLEIEGDEQLIVDASNFLWFPHTWRHNHVHEYSGNNLTILMQMNKDFAREKHLNVSLNYAISPQHSGVYPIHDALYDSWKSVWEVKVTSTEEYPHFAPPSKRLGFIYKNVSILPRQTCGLFTHTLYFHAMPEGLKSHQDSIFGGSLFKSLLLNQFSIFMTHQQNFGNDRLGSYTFLNAIRFMKCYTNLNFKWIPPVQLASKYFERFNNERQLYYTDICGDTRHLRSLPFDQTCTNVNKLPNTIIVGPQKTGTTAIREFLLLHPNVSSNQDVGEGFFEEPQFFAGSNYKKGLQWYRELFNDSKKSIVFEKTANYFDNPKAPEAIHHLIPSTKIVIILMDPSERAFSWYQHMRAHNDPTALKYTPMQIFSDEIESLEIRKLRNRCLQSGLYAKHLQKWLDFFPPNQLILLDSSMIRNEPANVMNSLISSLNLPKSIDYNQILKFDEQKGFFCVKNKDTKKCLGKSKGRKYEPMSNDLRLHLAKIFEKPNKSLKKLLNYYNFKLPSFLMGQ